MKCLRCGDPMTVFVVGDYHCQPCKREVAAILRQDARRVVRRYGVPKDLTPYGGAA